MKKVAVVQARMTSTRLPGKILADVLGAPMLEREIARLHRARTIDEIVLATTVNATDDPVAALAARLGIRAFRGSEEDVLSRYVGAAGESHADVVVRITADCPLIDADIVDDVVGALVGQKTDYASNVAERTFPRGLDVEAFTRDALLRCAELATSKPAREHVTWLMHTERPELFTRSSVTSSVDGSDLRWTVDTPEDLEMVRLVYSGMKLHERYAGYADILTWVRARPEVSRVNALIEQKKV